MRKRTFLIEYKTGWLSAKGYDILDESGMHLYTVDFDYWTGLDWTMTDPSRPSITLATATIERAFFSYPTYRIRARGVRAVVENTSSTFGPTTHVLRSNAEDDRCDYKFENATGFCAPTEIAIRSRRSDNTYFRSTLADVTECCGTRTYMTSFEDRSTNDDGENSASLLIFLSACVMLIEEVRRKKDSATANAAAGAAVAAG